MFERLWEPIENVQDYLDRISCGPSEEIRQDRESLDRLIRNHQIFVPFENLDIYDLDRDVSLNIGDIYEKVVARGRGGFCFELNALFQKLLEQLGFETKSCMGRIVRGKDYMPQPLHRVLLVKLEEGWHFCDVGYGGPMPAGALLLSDGSRRRVKDTWFRVRQISHHEWEISREKEDGEEGLVRFTEQEQYPMDFVAPSFFCCKHPDSYFRARRIVNRCLADGNMRLWDDTVTIEKDGKTEQVVFKDGEELREGLRKYFGIHILTEFSKN